MPTARPFRPAGDYVVASSLGGRNVDGSVTKRDVRSVATYEVWHDWAKIGTMTVTNEIYVSVDIEASGPIPGDYSMLSIGACIVGRPGQQFYKELRPISGEFLPDALKVSGLSMTALARTGAEPKDAMREFATWVRESSAGGQAVMVGFNAAFDWSFVNWYFLHFEIENPFGIGAVDIKSYYMGVSGASWTESRSSVIPEPYGSRGGHTHNAVDDAVEQASMFARMLAAPRQRINRTRT